MGFGGYVKSRTSLTRLRRRAVLAFEESSDAIRMSVVLRFQTATLRSLVIDSEPLPKTAGKQVAPPAGRAATLTPRERTVLELVVQGMTTRKIAEELGISFKTAATHRYSAMAKMGAANTAALVRDSLRLGIGRDDR
jgi:DNA-binding NarL/FixJ family response regulator